MPASTTPERMAAITAARQALREAKETAEARLRAQLKEDLAWHSTVLDLRIREAVEAGDRVSDIMRAFPTRDRHTITKSLSRTEGITADAPASEYSSRYQLVDETLFVNYTSFGPDEITATAQFTVERWEDGTFFLRALDGDGFIGYDNTITQLDGETDGFYYEDATAFLRGEFTS
ncbi:hypothetical protein CN1A_9 [Clavibacter phage CN1A]|uniref:Uncharacterized protein n=1 Tax=Clavibacter phage CN1A TaxID=1406793 RepID=U5PXE4_9CAUD|nr:hypothetical protein CN1A_9 [Clavibacter phage CN1A]AGY47118.1 hypothetical protein CN1A_9 [Clavibacter phage CN1A]